MKTESKTRAIIVDIDGTLANISARRMHVTGPKKDWKNFNANVHTDTLNVWCREIMVRMQNEFKILLVSGREGSLKKTTEKWLAENDVPYDQLFMRKAKDYRKDTIVKLEIYEKEIKPKYDIFFVIDDRASVVKMWREQGLVCLQCDEGDF